MPTTSNFGWTTPADTDLVKDGAAAIRTLGNGIDSSLIDLKGGTTGQVLSKASNTDLDYSWVTPNVGDITEVQAGTGISVASGTGPIPVITNTVATAFDAAGDIVYGTGADTFTKLALGTANQVLTVNSGATAPEWKTPSSGGGFTLLETLSLSGSATTSSTISGSYKHLHIQVRDVYFSANDTFYIRLNNDSGSNYWCYGLRIDAVNNSISGQYDTGVTVFTLCDLGNNSGALTRGVGSFWLWRYTDTSNVVKIDSTFNGYIAGNYRSMYEQGFYDNSAAITSITFRAGTGATTFSAGTAYIYGVS